MRNLAPALIACSFIAANAFIAVAEKQTTALLLFLSIFTLVTFFATLQTSPLPPKNEP